VVRLPKLTEKLEKYGIKIIGTSFEALDLAEDRGRFFYVIEGVGSCPILNLYDSQYR